MTANKGPDSDLILFFCWGIVFADGAQSAGAFLGQVRSQLGTDFHEASPRVIMGRKLLLGVCRMGRRRQCCQQSTVCWETTKDST